MTRHYLRLAAAVCAAMGVITLATFVVALFDPPPWNRVERLMQAWSWLYVAYLHARLALTIPPGRTTREATA